MIICTEVSFALDVSGGPSPCILDAIRAALDTSIHVSFSKKNHRPLDYQEAFYLATLGGAKGITLLFDVSVFRSQIGISLYIFSYYFTALAMDEKVGNFTVGKEFDALLVSVPDPDLHVESLDSLQLLQKFLYCGSERNIKEVYVQGRPVKQAF